MTDVNNRRKRGLKSLAVAFIIIVILLFLYAFLTQVKFTVGSYLWLFACLALILVEITTPFFFVLPFGVGCFFASVANLMGGRMLSQVLVFIGASVLFWVFLHFWVSGKDIDSGKLLNGDELIGAVGQVTVDINPPMKGRVYLQGNTWSAEADVPLEKGRKVIVRSLEGITLFVEEVSK